MEVFVVLACLVVLCPFHDIMCDKNEMLSRYNIHHGRTIRSHECDSQNLKQSKVCNNKARTLINTEHFTNLAPKSVTKEQPSIYESYESKDAIDVNNILNDITTIAQHKDSTNEIEKIRNLVTEIAKHGATTDNIDVKHLNKESTHSNVATVLNYVEPINHIETKETIPTVTSKSTPPASKEQIENEHAKIDLKHFVSPTETKAKETIIHYITVKEPIKDPIELQNLIKAESEKLRMKERSNNDSTKHGEKIRSTLQDENLVTLQEHEYVEELTRPPNFQNDIRASYDRRNYDLEYRNTYPEKGKYVETYNTDTDGNIYPYTNDYYTHGNKEYYKNNYNENWNPLEQADEENKDFTSYRKTELDRDTVISVNQNEQLVKHTNENKVVTMNIQSPVFYRKSYSVTQKRYSGDNQNLIQSRYCD